MKTSEIFNIPFTLLIDNIVLTIISKNSKNTLKITNIFYNDSRILYYNTIMYSVIIMCYKL